MSQLRGACEECGGAVYVHETAAFVVTGFEVERSGGGTNALRHRQRAPNRIWHERCVDTYWRRQRGYGEQVSLL